MLWFTVWVSVQVFWTVSRTSDMFRITVTFSFIRIFRSQVSPSICLASFTFTVGFSGIAKPTWWQVLFFLWIKKGTSFLVCIELSVCVSKPQRIFCISLLRTDSGLYICHLLVRENFSTIPDELPYLSSRSCYLVLVFCIHLIRNSLFHLYPHINCVYYFPVYHRLFSDIISPVGFFVLVSLEIQFLSSSFLFVTIPRLSNEQFPWFVA